MMTMLFTKPGKVMAYPKVMNALQNQASGAEVGDDENGFMPNYEGVVPDWIQEMWGYKIQEENDAEHSETYFNMATPQMDIYKGLSHPGQQLSTLTNPLIKVPYEQSRVGTKVFDQEGDALPGNDMNFPLDSGEKRIDELMRQLPTTSMANKEWRGRGSKQTRLSFLSGLGFYENNDDRRKGEFY
jgi:hypothetical protein